MLEIVPVQESRENTDKIKYISNIENDSIAKKYNRAIEEFVLNSDEEIICFRHDDLSFREPMDVIEYNLREFFKDKKIGIAGVIGCLALYEECVWWIDRETQGLGAIIQGNIRPVLDKNKKPIFNEEGKQIFERFEHFMAGDLQDRSFKKWDCAATVDGCVLYFPKWIFEKGLRFDESLPNYHFYDADICCQVLSKGYKVGIIDTVVKHESRGEMPKEFGEYAKIFHDKWDKKIDHWPISRLTKFKE